MGYFVGAISGTSTDGLDLAIIKMQEASVSIKQSITIPFPNSLRNSLLELATSYSTDIVKLGQIAAELGTFVGEQIVQFITTAGYATTDIEAIGSHGQTIRHVPEGFDSFSYQIGDASRIAAITGINTISDFRSADIAVGGQGAPLVPIFHDRIFRSEDNDRVILNVGGIANITLLPANRSQVVIGFDTGPGNALLDVWTQHCFGRNYDSHGKIANSGTIDEALLTQLVSDPWLENEPPKSTGREHFNLGYVQNHIRTCESKASPENVLTTLTEFSALTISRAIKQWCCETGEVITCGGGRLNKFLVARLRHHLPNHMVLLCDDHEVDGDAVEAATFAYLAYLFVENKVGNIPSVTGARRPRVLGCLYPK